MKINNLQEATSWFLGHSSGSVVCVKGLQEKTCSTYPEAELFYSNEDLKDLGKEV